MIIYLGNNLSSSGNTPSSIETLGVLLGERYTVRRYSDKKNQLLRGLHMAFGLLKNRKAEVVLIDTYSSLGFYFAVGAAITCRALRIPYIPILRGGNLKYRLEKNPLLCAIVFGGAEKMVAPSSFLFSVFSEYGYDKIVHIPNSIEIALYPMKVRRTLSPRLFWVRAFHKVYNPMMALDVFGKLRENFPEAVLCMVGPDRDGTLDQCRDIVKSRGWGGSVEMPGLLSKDVWHAKSVSFDIFINTTTIDNTPVSVIEAMALGLPVVSTNVGGIQHLLKDHVNGILVKSGDVEEMEQKIQWLLAHPDDAANLALNARTLAASYDWEQVKLQWFKLLDPYCTNR